LLGILAICAVAGGILYYKSKCHGVDTCAAEAAESQERDKPTETQ
jgi:hypothetical protein